MSAMQLTLDAAADVHVPARSLADRYAAWLADNPGILDVFADTVRQLLADGRRVSINRVFEECRERVHTVGDEYVLNNSWRAFVARDLAERDEFDGVFQTRTSKADRR